MKFSTVILRILTASAWLLMIASALPIGLHLPDALALLVQTVACMGLIVELLAYHSAPMIEVYMAGKQAGRNEMRVEQETGVVHIEERRLSIVG